MSKKSKNFDDRKINKINFYKSKKLLKIDDIDADQRLVSQKEPYGTKKLLKYLIGYNGNVFYWTTMCKASSNDWMC